MQVPEYDAQKSMLAQQRVPGMEDIKDEDEKYKADVASRPDSCTAESYSSVPVSMFGDAYMRSLGWTPGAPLGKSNAAYVLTFTALMYSVVDVVKFIPRTPGLGLGAKLNAAPEEFLKEKGKNKKKGISKPGEKYAPRAQMELPMDKDGRIRHHCKLDEELKPVKEAFYKGAPLYILRGPHNGLKAKVISRHGHDSLLVLLPSEEKVVVYMNEVEQLDDRDVMIRRKREEEERKEAEKQRRDRDRERERNDKKRKREDGDRKADSSSKHNKKTKSSSSVSTKPPQPSWLRADIRVKIISKKLGEGKFYCKAGWVEDVLPRARCCVRLENSNLLLEGIKEDDLETVVPAVKQPVIVVKGEWKGQRGVILERESSKNRLVVQLDEDYEIVTLRMDDAAQFRT